MNLKLSTKLYAGFIFVLLLMVVVAGIGYFSLEKTVNILDEIVLEIGSGSGWVGDYMKSNGWTGYVPTVDEFERGGYEVELGSAYAPGAAEALESAVFNWAQHRGVNLQQLGIDVHNGEEEEGRIVCKCFSLSEPYIKRKIKELNLRTIPDITGAIKAGGACMSCHHTPGGLQDMLDEVWSEAIVLASLERFADQVRSAQRDPVHQRLEQIWVLGVRQPLLAQLLQRQVVGGCALR